MRDLQRREGSEVDPAREAPSSPGKVTLTQQLQRRRAPDAAPTAVAPDGPEAAAPTAADDPFATHLLTASPTAAAVRGAPVVQFLLGAGGGAGGDVHEVAARGVSGGGGALPYLDHIQASFGADHDVSHVRAHVGGDAAIAAGAIGAEAYAMGDAVGFRGAPDLHTAAHEAAHVVQQQAGIQLLGGVGADGDVHERHADAVADRVVAGRSSADLLADYPGGGGAAAPAIQRRRLPGNLGALLADPKDPDAPGPNFDANMQGMLTLLERAVKQLTEPELVTIREKLFAGGVTIWDLIKKPPHQILTILNDAIIAVRPDLELGDPNLIDIGPRTGTDDAKHLKKLGKNAEKIFDAIIGGSHDTSLAQVFGKANIAAAKTKYKAGLKWMKKLIGDDKVVTDRSGYSKEVGLGGLTGTFSQISVSPGSMDAPDDPKSIITMIHESTHAGNTDVEDFGYIQSTSFTELPEATKLNNAAHFEVVPRRILKTDFAFDGETFTPAGTGSKPALTATQQAIREASEHLRSAWTIGLNLHTQFVNAFKKPTDWTTDQGGGNTFQGGLPYWSKVEKMTIHLKKDIDPADANPAKHPVSVIDIALSEGLTRKLAQSMKRVPKTELDAEIFEGVNATDAERTAAHASVAMHKDFIIKLILTQPDIAPLTGSFDRDRRVVDELVDIGTHWGDVLMTRNPDDFKD